VRGALLFVLGVGVGLGAQSAVGQPRDIVSLNHVAISVENFDQASKFYGQDMGFPEAFAFREADGSPALSYFQINRNTFIELMPATPARPAGFVHFGLEVTNLDALVDRLRARGVTVGTPSVSARTKSRVSVARTPQGTSFELLEFGPNSLHRKVMDAWK
jgi:predicted enzyme related to lactoylglutathione lyase